MWSRLNRVTQVQALLVIVILVLLVLSVYSIRSSGPSTVVSPLQIAYDLGMLAAAFAVIILFFLRPTQKRPDETVSY